MSTGTSPAGAPATGVARGPRAQRPPLRIALRLAARNARRSLGRSILIVLMMAIPVAGMSATAVVVSSSNATAQELVDLHLADAEGVMQLVGGPGTVGRQAVRSPIQGWWDQRTPENTESLPSGPVDPVSLVDGRVIPIVSTLVTLESDGRLRQVQASAGEVFVDELAGRYELLSGTPPRADTDLVVSPALRDALDLSVGSVVVTQPDGIERTIVGIGRSTHDADDVQRAFGSAAGLDVEGVAANQFFNTLYYVLDEPLSWDDVLALNELGIVATSRDVILGGGPYPGAAAEDFWGSAFGFQGTALALAAMIGAFLLLQVVFLAGAAFMVGARQQQRSLAVLASVGGDRRLMRAVVTTGGVVLGLAGSMLGLAVGVVAGAVYMELSRDGRATQYPGFHLDPVLLGAMVIAATGAGWLAAVVPARVATRIDIVSALRGARRPAVPRRGAKRLSVAVLLSGAALLVAGGVLLVVLRTLDEYPPVADAAAVGAIALGAVVLQLGVVLALPMILRVIARATASTHTALRLAARDSGRNSGRTVPVAAAVMTTVFVSTFLMGVFGAVQVDREQWYSPQAPLNSVLVSARTADMITGELSPLDNTEAVRAGVSDIAGGAEATLIEGVYSQDYWGWDQLSGDPIAPPEGTTTIVIPLDPEQVCPAVLGPPTDLPQADYNDWFVESEGSPLCGVGLNNSLFSSNPYTSDPIRVGSREQLEAATGMTLTPASVEVLKAGGAVSIFPEYVADGIATIRWVDSAELVAGVATAQRLEPVREESLSAIVQEPPSPVYGGLLMFPETARDLGLETMPLAVIAYPEFTLGQSQRDALLELSRDVTGDPWGLSGTVETGPADIVGPAAWALVAVSGVIALTASAIAIGLARIDGRRDEAILGAIGATRRLRRAVSFWQAVLLAGLGAVIGAVLGVAAAGALALPGGPMPFAPPVAQLLIAAVGVPFVIALGAWLFAGKSSALPTDRSAIA